LWAKEFETFIGYTPFKDFNNGDFVLVKPRDLLLIPMWMGRPQCDFVRDEENKNFKMERAQWWILVKIGSNLDEQCLYEDCMNGKWKCNLTDVE